MTNPQFPGQTISPVYKPMTFQTPVAASQQFVTTPGQQPTAQTGTVTSLGLPTAQSTTALSPLLLPTVPSDITGVYAPNVGQYTQFQDKADSGDTTTPTTPTTPTPTTPADPRAGAADSGGGNGRDESAPGATAVLGNQRYELAYDSSTRKPGIQGALMSLGNIDQVKLTDPNTGQSAFMSRDRYNTLKDTEDRASVDSFMNDLFAAQEGVDYQGNRAREIYNAANPVKGFVRGIGAGLGYMDDFGPSRAENQAAAKAIADDMGIEYKGQSLAEMIAQQPTRTESGMPLAPVFTVDAAGNRVPMDRGQTPTGLATTPETALTAQQFRDQEARIAQAQGMPVAAPTVAAPTTMATPRSLSSFGISPEERALAAPVSPARDTFASPEAFRRNEARIAQAQGMMAPSTGMVQESVIETANALIARGVPATRALEMAQETARTGVVSPSMQRELAPPLEGIVQTSYGPMPERSSVDLQMRDAGLRQGPSFDDRALGRSTMAADRFEEGDFEIGSSYVGDDDDGPSPEQEAANRAAEAAREREQRNAQSYERDGFSPEQAANRAAADARAQRQTGNPNARAAKDARTGKAVGDGKGGVVTSGEVRGDKRDDPPARQGPSFDDSATGKDDSGKGKIVCTEMYRQTQLDDWAKAIKIWDIYQKKHLTPLHEVGYHWLFKPYVHGMKRSGILTATGAFLAKKRTQHLKHILTKGRAKDSFVGNVWCKIIHPIVYLVGKMVYKK